MNVFKLVGTFAIEGVSKAEKDVAQATASAKKGFEEMEQSSSRSSGSLSGALGKVGSVAGTVGKAGVAALGAASTAAVAGFAAVAKGSLDAFSSYEQLTGGVETLFKGSAPVVEEYAANAYKTAGLSANDYMTQVTSFSASLLQSLGGDTAAAADKADMAVTDMSDNANKMGSSIGSIQDAYQGFAKQNYTMLDNLKLGYGGTQEEMQRLLSDAEAISGVHYDMSSYADVVDAIHVVQAEMGITGTTAREASTTIEGSVNSAKAAWTNWLTDLGRDDADMAASTQQLVESVITAANNIIPRMVQILTTLGTTLAQQLPMIVAQLGTVITENGPPLLAAAGMLFASIVQALVQIAPQAIAGLLGLLGQLVQYLIDNMPAILDGAITLFGGILSALVEAAPQILLLLAQLLLSLVAAVGARVGDMLSGAAEMMGGFVSGLGSVDVLGVIDGIINGILGAFAGAGSWLVDAGASILNGLWEGISGGLDWLGGQLAGIGDFIVEHKGPPEADAVMLEGNGALIMGGLVRGILGGVPALQGALDEVTAGITVGAGSKAGAAYATTSASTPAATSASSDGGQVMVLLAQILAALNELLEAYVPANIDGDVLVSKTSKRMERSIVKRNKLTGGIA